jgi:hypothetical protein
LDWSKRGLVTILDKYASVSKNIHALHLPTHKGILHNFPGVRNRSKHLIGNPHQMAPARIKVIRVELFRAATRARLLQANGRAVPARRLAGSTNIRF